MGAKQNRHVNYMYTNSHHHATCHYFE